jgi:hypothetical protein
VRSRCDARKKAVDNEVTSNVFDVSRDLRQMALNVRVSVARQWPSIQVGCASVKTAKQDSSVSRAFASGFKCAVVVLQCESTDVQYLSLLMSACMSDACA